MSVLVVADAAALPRRPVRTWLRAHGWWVWVAVLGIIAVLAVFGPWLAPFEHTQQNVRAKFTPPFSSSAAGFHVFGTDELGRDVFSKVIVGTRLTVFIAMMSTLIGATIGTVAGMVAGFRGGRVDRVIMRLTEAQTAMPMFLIALLLLSSLGASAWNLIAILPTYVWPTFARLIRAETMRLRSAPFVEAAVALGCPTRTILGRHLLPNLSGRVAVLVAISVGQVVLAEAGLSFIGAGVQPPSVTWGLMISLGRKYLTVAWWATVFPGLFVGLTVVALNGVARAFTDEGRR